MDLSNWTAIGGATLKLYPNGVLGIVRKEDGGKEGSYTCDTISPGGNLDDTPLCENNKYYGSEADMIAGLDAKFAPQPEDHCFDTITVYRLGGKENFAFRSGSNWFAHKSDGQSIFTRDAAEKMASDWLKQQPQ